MQLENKTIVLTGAAGGMGRAIAVALDKAGARLLLTDLAADRLQDLQCELGGCHQVVAADLGDAAGRAKLMDACHRVGSVDVLINAAGISEFTMLDSQIAERIEKQTTINLVVPMILCKEILPLLRQRPEAAIVNIGSTFGSIGYPGFAAYCANKFGLRGFTEALRRELADSPVKVLYLAPRATRTEMNSTAVNEMNLELGNAMDSPEIVAQALISVLKSGGKNRFIGWPEKLFVRLNGLVPGVVDRALRSQLPTIRRYANSE